MIGVADNGEVTGLQPEDVRRLNQMISNTASEMVKPPIHPITEVTDQDGTLVLLVHIAEGLQKPYCTNAGVYLTKSGADKRKMSQDELLRLFQASKRLYGEELPLADTEIDDLDLALFREFYARRYNESLEEAQAAPDQVLHNMNLMAEGHVNVAGLMLFGRQKFVGRPFSEIRATVTSARYPTQRTHARHVARGMHSRI